MNDPKNAIPSKRMTVRKSKKKINAGKIITIAPIINEYRLVSLQTVFKSFSYFNFPIFPSKEVCFLDHIL